MSHRAGLRTEVPAVAADTTCSYDRFPMFGMGVGELLVVLVAVLLVFGPGRLPEMMGNLGQAMREFQKALREPPDIEAPAKTRTPPADSKREGS